jgi:hypothetical protein
MRITIRADGGSKMGLWCRQWQNWAYGEASKYRTRIEGDRIQWFNAQGRLIDSAIFVPAGPMPGGGDAR